MRSLTLLRAVTVCLLACSPIGCGYAFRSLTSASWLREQGVRSLYIAPITNNSYRAGLEGVVHSALVRKFTAGRRISIVSSPGDADAILYLVINAAGYRAYGSQEYYDGGYSCSVTIERVDPPHGAEKVLFREGCGGGKRFAISNSGSPSDYHVNESQGERGYLEGADRMAEDLEEKLFGTSS